MHFLVILFFIIETHGYKNILHPSSMSLFNFTNYDSSVRPPGLNNPNDPVKISINLFVRSIDRIDTSKHEYDIQITFRQAWTDKRLAWILHDGVENEVTVNEVKPFWKPDVFFSNEKRGHFHNIMLPNAFMKINSQGEVMLSTRVTLTLACQTDPWEFPFDMLNCPLRMPSYGYTTKDMILTWRVATPVQYSDDFIKAAGFDVNDMKISTCESNTTTGVYSCLMVLFLLQRRTTPYLVRSYFPYALISMASWVPFWISAHNSNLRVIIGLLACLTSLLLPQGDEDQPNVDITKLDIWIGLSILLVFMAFFESITILMLSRFNGEIREKADEEVPEDSKKTSYAVNSSSGTTHKLDHTSRMAFPLFYMFFGIVYFFI